MVLSRYLNNLLLILLIAASFGDINAQGTTDDQLAAYYYREGSFDKAVIYYDRLYENNLRRQLQLSPKVLSCP